VSSVERSPEELPQSTDEQVAQLTSMLVNATERLAKLKETLDRLEQRRAQ